MSIGIGSYNLICNADYGIILIAHVNNYNFENYLFVL